jgi:hypothetical protein
MDLRDRARSLREQAEAARKNAQTSWDVLTEARTALAVVDADDPTSVPEYQRAMDALAAYNGSAEASTKADDAYTGILALLGEDAPQGSPLDRITQRAPDGVGRRSMGEAFTSSEVFQNLRKRISAGEGSSLPIGVTPAVKVTTREEASALMRRPQGAVFSTPDEVVAPDQSPGIRPLPLLPPLTVLDLITIASTDSTSVKWVIEKAFTNAAAEVAESVEGTPVTKPESALELDVVTYEVTTIAHWIPASKQALRDVAGVRSLIDAKLEWGLRRRAALQLIAGNGSSPNLRGICNTTGIGHVDRSGSDAMSLIEDIYDGVYTIGDAYGEAPNVCLVSRADYKLLGFARDNSGFEGGTGAFIYGPPTSVNPIDVEGCLVLPNFDLPSGMSVMGVWRELAMWMHEGISIAASDSHASYFVQNLVAILAEMAAAAGPMETKAFCEISPAEY